MDIQFGPNAIDEPNLLYKLQHKIKVFNTCDSLNNRGYNLIASSSKYGIVFIASPDSTLSVYYIKQLINKESDIKHVQVKLQEKPTHIGVSCDYELLAVTGGQLLTVYKIVDFQMQNVAPTCNIRCDVNPSNCVSALQWNPCIPDSIALAYFDGTLMACQVTTGQTKKIASKARCICWSPKGKQLVTGNSDGSLTQYKPDLTPAKTVPAPNLFENAPVEALAIYWISTFQFAVVFRRASDNSRPAMAVVNTPKAGQPSCLNYEDICYSSGPNRPWYYYLWGVPQWNIILASSSNSMEIATLGSADGASWLPWSQSDEARPELPLTDKKLENYPVGVCIDTGAIHQLPWGENETLPHMPLMMVLSHSGLLTIFNIINLNKQAPQICAPPQSLMLPATAMTSEIPGVSPAPAQPPPASVPPQPQSPPVLQPVNTQPFQPVQPTQTQQPQPFQPVQPTQTQQPPAGLFSSFTVPLKPAEPQPLAHLPQEVEQKLSIIQNIPPVVQPQARKVQTPKPAPEPKAVQSPEVNAALKEEQEKITKLKADQELKGMLLKEVNDFQNEVYKFNVKIRDGQNKLYKDINSLSSDFDLQSLNVDQLRKDCGLEDLRAAVVQLKLDLVRACAAVAETRTHTEMKDFHEWSHADPLTTKRVANIKKMAYYVQNQLEQAQKALDHKWSDMLSKNPLYNKPGHRMIRPILDDIYQPLVKQQEILGRQQAVLRTLRNTLNECNSSPVVKSTSILRSTPFRNKDNLSKLTKNILNMSIESQMPKSEGYLSAQKLDALRDLLANNRPTKIKPVTVEMTQHLKAVRLSYEKSLKEKAAQKAAPQPQAQIPQKVAEPAPIPQMKPQAKPDVVKPSQPTIQQSFSQISQQTTLPQSIPQSALPSFRSINNLKPNVPQAMNQSIQPGLANVSRTLFSDQSSHELPRPQSSSTPIPAQQPKPQVAQEKIQPVSSVPTPTIDTKSVLKELLKSKSALANLESKNDNNTFLGQKICSPTSFTFSSNTSTPSSTNFADKSSIFKTLQPDQVKEIKALSDETGEIETSVKPNDAKKEEKSIFDIKTSTPLSASSQFVPDVLKSATQGFGVKAESKTLLEKPDSQENVTDKNKDVPLKLSTKGNVTKAEESKPTLFASSQAQPIPATPEDKTEEKPADKTPENPSIVASSASSIFASTNASKPVIGVATSSIFGAVSSSETSKSLFSSLQTSQQSSSIFSPTIVSSNSQMGSIFGTKSATTSIEIKPIETDSEKVSIASTASPVTTGTDAKSIFGSSASETSETKEVPKTESSSKIEIAPTTTATFAFATTAPESKPSIFSTPTPATSAPVFGNQSAFATTKPSIFGSSASSVFASANAQQPTSIFGATVTTTQTVFGGTTTTTQSAFAPTTKESAFAAAPLFGAATTAQSAFSSTTATTQASIFGTATAPTQSIFGSPTTQAPVFGGQQKSVFGSPAQATAPTTQSSVFGAPTTQAFSIFSTGGSNTTQTSIFGAQPATTTSGGSLFGGGESNLFAAASISTTNAPSQVTGSIFGGSTGSAFSNTGANVFGGKTTFGQPNPAAASIFGNSPVSGFGQKQDTANNFWGNNSKPESDSSSNWFGKEQPTTQASSIFGGTTGGSFSAPAPGGAFGSPQPQGSVFGTPQQQKGPGFGGSAGFGSKAVFGQSTGFGSPPAAGGFGSFGGFNKSPASGFGGPAAFGAASAFGAPAFGSTSPGKVFGGATDAGPAFGATQSNATFENLATQNTLSFGNLAQQSQTPPAAPSFNTSPSFTGWRG